MYFVRLHLMTTQHIPHDTYLVTEQSCQFERSALHTSAMKQSGFHHVMELLTACIKA